MNIKNDRFFNLPFVAPQVGFEATPSKNKLNQIRLCRQCFLLIQIRTLVGSFSMDIKSLTENNTTLTVEMSLLVCPLHQYNHQPPASLPDTINFQMVSDSSCLGISRGHFSFCILLCTSSRSSRMVLLSRIRNTSAISFSDNPRSTPPVRLSADCDNDRK